MTGKILIKNALIVNEGRIREGDVFISGGVIEKTGKDLSPPPSCTLIDARGQYLLPGMIDDQVHFREPGLTHKGDIESESRAAVAGGITSFIDMPNTLPQTTTCALLEEKIRNATGRAYANFGFMLGGTNDNLDELLRINIRKAAGIKLFLGSSTGNMLVDNPDVLEEIFRRVPSLIAVHCEEESVIRQNTERYTARFGEDIPVILHPEIRNAHACYLSSSKAVELAKKTGARLHVFHLSTAGEMSLFDPGPLRGKNITAEVCVHHLLYEERDYHLKGKLIKCNPAIKSGKHRKALWKALSDDRIDVIATDHAPHTREEKERVYTQSPSGIPMVQHALPVLFEFHKQGLISLEKIVEKTAHNPAILFGIKNRGFIREGYYADLVLADMQDEWKVTRENILYKCGWSPLEGKTFSTRITHTFVNGVPVYSRGALHTPPPGMALAFGNNRK